MKLPVAILLLPSYRDPTTPIAQIALLLDILGTLDVSRGTSPLLPLQAQRFVKEPMTTYLLLMVEPSVGLTDRGLEVRPTSTRPLGAPSISEVTVLALLAPVEPFPDELYVIMSRVTVVISTTDISPPPTTAFFENHPHALFPWEKIPPTLVRNYTITFFAG